ncbi:MAG: RagB/SusD family nutrient uptake outer membrane protein [Muribaculaceae bacterium]
MKILRISILMIAAALFNSSCDDFLDMQPTNASNAETAIATADDAQVAINGVMRAMTSSVYYGRNFMIYGDAKGGDLTIYSAGRGLDALYSFNHSATSGSYSGFWTQGYYCISQVNNIISNIKRLQNAGKNGFDTYLGQAYTLRALFYFDLVRLYGLPYNYDKSSYGVPLVTEPIEASAQPSRATVEEIYKQIISDLKTGAELLSADKRAVDSYIGYYANIALQARAYLYMEDYNNALNAAKEIIDCDRYALYKPSTWVDSWRKQYGSESIFELGIDSDNDLGSSSLGYYYMRYKRVSGAQGWFLASDYFLERLGEDPEDVRWGVMDVDEEDYDYGTGRRGACYKYMGSTELHGDGKETPSAVNIKVIRLSEIYLIASEAALALNSKDDAAEYLNAIRCRAPNLEPANESTISVDMILNERSKEFFGEGQRFFDMIRLNREIEFNDDFQDVPVSSREKVIDRTYYKIVLPISQDEINANAGIKGQQNNGY